MPKQLKKILAGLLTAVSCCLLFSILAATSLLDLTNQKLTHSLYNEREINDDIIIIAIDEQTLSPTEEGGLGQMGRWSYEVYADALNNLSVGNPSVVFFDIIFFDDETSYIPTEKVYEAVSKELPTQDFVLEILSYLNTPNPMDEAFINALENSSNTILAKYGVGEGVFDGESIVFESETSPSLLFTDVSETAYINSQVGEDRTIYETPYQITVGSNTEKHVDIKIAEKYLGKEILDIPTNEGNWIINYSKKSFGYPIYSFSDLQKGRIDPSVFEDKIVLIGVTATIAQDLFSTPIDDEVLMPGVEVRANGIQTLLDQEFLKYQDTIAFVSLIAVIALISVFAFLYLPIWAGLAVLLVEIVAFPFYAQWRFDNGVIINLIWPVFAMVASYLLVLAYRNVTEFKEKRKLRNAFSHYVSPELVNQISASGDDLVLGGERRYMTTLFLDIENFTSLSEKLEPHDVVSIINKYFDAFAKEIMSHGGTVDKFEGDAIMALFGAPIKSEDHALKACQTAMAIRSKVEELNKGTGQNLNVRVGIATGDCIVGNMGSEQRFDYTAMGDTVNTASRLEGGNKFYGTRILVNAGTMEASHEHIFFRRIDRVRLKGKDEAIDIYEVMGTNEAVSEAGKLIVNEWHTALEYYRNQDWASVESKLREILEKLPDDGPTLTYLGRVEKLKANPPQGWDGTWTFTSK